MPPGYDPFRTVVLTEETNRIKGQKRAKDIRIAGSMFGLCGVLALVLGLGAAATAGPGSGVLHFVLFMGTFLAGAFALMGAVVLVIRLFSK